MTTDDEDYTMLKEYPLSEKDKDLIKQIVEYWEEQWDLQDEHLLD